MYLFLYPECVCVGVLGLSGWALYVSVLGVELCTTFISFVQWKTQKITKRKAGRDVWLVCLGLVLDSSIAPVGKNKVSLFKSILMFWGWGYLFFFLSIPPLISFVLSWSHPWFLLYISKKLFADWFFLLTFLRKSPFTDWLWKHTSPVVSYVWTFPAPVSLKSRMFLSWVSDELNLIQCLYWACVTVGETTEFTHFSLKDTVKLTVAISELCLHVLVLFLFVCFFCQWKLLPVAIKPPLTGCDNYQQLVHMCRWLLIMTWCVSI